MHVLVVLTYGVSFSDWKNNGLLERELLIYEKIEKESDVKFSFLSFGNEEDKELVKNFEVFPIFDYYDKKNNKFLNFLQSLFLPFKLKKIMKKPDIIKTNQLMGAWTAIVCKLLYSVPLIVRTGYDIFRFSIYEKKSLKKRVMYFLLTQIAIIFSNVYIVSSKTNKIFLHKFFLFSKNKVVVLPNWVDTSYIFEQSKILSRQKDRILSVGRLEAQKNYPLLIKSFENSDIEIDIVGSGSEKQKLKNLANSLNVNLNFLGNIPNNELLNIYKNYMIYISSSSYEGNSKSILEAKAAGCMTFAIDTPNNKEIINDGHDGFLYRDKSQLIEILNDILKNDKKILEISNNALKNVDANNSLKFISNSELNIYRRLNSRD